MDAMVGWMPQMDAKRWSVQKYSSWLQRWDYLLKRLILAEIASSLVSITSAATNELMTHDGALIRSQSVAINQFGQSRVSCVMLCHLMCRVASNVLNKLQFPL